MSLGRTAQGKYHEEEFAAAVFHNRHCSHRFCWNSPQQHPFVCTTTQGAVGRQPLIESATPPGTRVFDGSGNVIGYSRDCSIDTFVTYLYRTTGNARVTMPADGSRPADMSTVTLADGRTVDFVVRREIGSINPFFGTSSAEITKALTVPYLTLAPRSSR